MEASVVISNEFLMQAVTIITWKALERQCKLPHGHN